MPADDVHPETALLRSPPHYGAVAAVSVPGPRTAAMLPPTDEIDRLFATLREARVGGRFWGRQASAPQTDVVVRSPLGNAYPGAYHMPLGEDVDPWSILRAGLRLVADGDDEWIAIAHLAGCSVEMLSAGRFGTAGAGADEIRSRVAEHLYGIAYRDPFTDQPASIETAIARLAEWRRLFEANRGIVAACGIAWWKRREIARFLETPARPLRFYRSERRALRHAAKLGGAVAIWPSRVSARMPGAAQAHGVQLVRVEDGFVRSVGLGSNLVPPSSVTADRLGIYYDASKPSDLEVILSEASFPAPLLERAERLRETILRAGISKYGIEQAHVFPDREAGRKLVLVPGQVEDDMSVRLGGAGLCRNLDLLRRARELEPQAEIWFRPHPDVDAGHRRGAVPDEEALGFADRIVRGGSMAALLDRVDAVHVLTSLTGFEALLRDRAVTCHGVPFYAGWGLTRDLAQVPDRRGRQLSFAQLVAAVLILYPRYLDPVTQLPCAPEVLIARMSQGGHNRLGWVSRVRELQGRLLKRFSRG